MKLSLGVAVLSFCFSLDSQAATRGPGEVAQPPNCHKLSIDPTEDFHYTARDGRCEGSFQPQLSDNNGTIHLMGLIDVPSTGAPSSPQSGTGALLSWTPTGNPVYLLARSLRPDIHYRMETAVASGNAFSWDLQVVRSCWKDDKPDGDIAALAFTALDGQRSYRAVQVDGPALSGNEDPGTYVWIFDTNTRIKDVKATAKLMPSKGERRRQVNCDRPLAVPMERGRQYDSGDDFRLRLPKSLLRCPGEYKLVLEATTVHQPTSVAGEWVFTHVNGR